MNRCFGSCASCCVFLLSDVSESVLHSMKRSRRLLFVLSPDLLAEKTFGLLECRLGLFLQRSLQASVVAVVYRSVSKMGAAEVAQLRRAAGCTVTWRGSRSEPQRSRFWLRLRLALPVRPLALGRRLIDSTSSHSDLAALALQRVQRIQNQNRRGRTNQTRKTSANQSLLRGRGSMSREEGPQRTTTCSGCVGFTDRGKERRVELTVETAVQQVLCDGTHPDPGSTQIRDSTHNTNSHAHLTGSTLPSDQQVGKQNFMSQHQLIGSRISEEVMSAEEGEGLVVKKTLTPPPTENIN